MKVIRWLWGRAVIGAVCFVVVIARSRDGGEGGWIFWPAVALLYVSGWCLGVWFGRLLEREGLGE